MRNRKQELWQKLRKQGLVSENENGDSLIWADEKYILFRSQQYFYVGRLTGAGIQMLKKIDARALKADEELDVLHPDSAIFLD